MKRKWISLLTSLLVLLLAIPCVVVNAESSTEGRGGVTSEDGSIRYLLKWVYRKMYMRISYEQDFSPKEYTNLTCERVFGEVNKKMKKQYKRMISDDIYEILPSDELFSVPSLESLEDIWSPVNDPRLTANSITTQQELVDYIAGSISSNFDTIEDILTNFTDSIINVQTNDNLKKPFQKTDSTSRLPIECSRLPVSDQDFTIEIEADSNRNRTLFPEKDPFFPLNSHDKLTLTFKKVAGFMNTVDVAQSCIFVNRMCQEKSSDCPTPIDENHEYLYENFNAELLNIVRQDTRLANAIKNVHFTSPVGVTIVNPAQAINNMAYRHHAAGEGSYELQSTKYQKDMRDFPSYRMALDITAEEGLDIVFFVDTAKSMIYDSRHIEITNAIAETVRNLNIQDRFTVVGSATTKSCAEHQNLPGFNDCTENESRVWNFDNIPENSYEFRKTNKIYTPQYTCLKSKLAFANNAIKDKVSFLLERSFLVNDGRSFWNFHGEKNFAAGFDKIADLFRNSGQTNREKLIIMFTDGEPLDAANQIQTLNSLNALQKEFNYKINTQIYNLGNTDPFLKRIVNQDYDVWNDETNLQTGHVIQADYGHQDSLSSTVKRFYMYSPFLDSSSDLKWTWVNTIKDQVGLENELNLGPTLSVSKAIFDSSDQLIGVMSMDINTDRLLEPLVDMELGINRYFVVDSDNQHIISHPQIKELQHFDHRIKKGFTKNYANVPHLLDTLFYVSQIENSAELNSLIQDPTTSISLPRNYYCSSINSHYTVCSYTNNANNSTIEAFVPHPADDVVVEPEIPFVVLNQELDETVALAHKKIDDSFSWWKKDKRKMKEFPDLGNAAAQNILGLSNLATCNYNDRIMYLTGEEHRSYLSISPSLNQINDLGGLESYQNADLVNLASFLNSDMNSNSDFLATGLRGNLTEFPVEQINALKLLTKTVGFTKAPKVAYQNITKPLRREFILPTGYGIQFPAIQNPQNFDSYDLSTVGKDEYYFKLASDIDEGLGTTVSMVKQAKIFDKFIGYFVNTWSWIGFHDVIERMIWSSKTFRCMCPYPPNQQYDSRYFFHYYGTRHDDTFNYFTECAVKLMNEEGKIVYDEQMRYEYEMSKETTIKRKGYIPLNKELNIIQTYSIYDLVWNSLHHHLFSGDHLMDHFDGFIVNPKYNGSFVKRWVQGEDQINEEKYGDVPYVFTPMDYLDITKTDTNFHSKVYSDNRVNSTAYQTNECFDIYHHQIYKKYQHLIPEGYTSFAVTQDSPAYNSTISQAANYVSIGTGSQIAYFAGGHTCSNHKIIEQVQAAHSSTIDIYDWWVDTNPDNWVSPAPYFHFKRISNTNLHAFIHVDAQSPLEKPMTQPMMMWFIIFFRSMAKFSGWNCHHSFQIVRGHHLKWYRYYALKLPKGKLALNAVWWTEDLSGRFTANPAYDACSHDVPVGLNGEPMEACANSVYRYGFDINEYLSSEETKDLQKPSIWEAPCVIDFHHPSTVSVNTYDATSAKFASLARQLPIIGNWIADFMNLQFPISSDYNLIRINQFLYKHSFKTFCHIAFLLWFYYYVLIKLLWRRAFGQDMRMVLKRIMRRKNQLYLDENDSEEEDDEIDDAFYDSFDLALYNQKLDGDEFFDFDVLD